ncbi:MAG: hypothetical protein IKB93_08370 [Clostridia bacterium]|nr:hypothetical protein [Clostridia bacterium]
MNYLIGLDIGTSSVKGVLMTENGEIIKTAHGAFCYTRTDDGGVEIEADKFADVCFGAIKELAQAADGEIKGICASSASGNLVVLDKDMKPATPIFNWQDQRTTTEAKEILGEMDLDAFYRQIGWHFSYKGFPLALLCYVKRHTPEKIANCGKVCMSTEYLYYRLTGTWGISSSAGTPFYLIDQNTGEYIPEILDKLGIDTYKLPPIMPCGSSLGNITQEASEKCGLSTDTAVVLGSFDHPSAARGVGVFNEGEILLSCGTSWVGFCPIKDREKAADAGVLIDPFLSPKGGCYGTMVSVSSVAERIKLYVDRYIDNTENAYQILEDLAEKSSLGADGLALNLYDEPDDSKMLSFSKESIARAIMEGTVNLLKEKLDVIKGMGVDTKTAVMVGGPSGCKLYHKLIEEICGISVRVLHGSTAGAVGAAMLAGIGTGIYTDEADANFICNRKE